MIFIFEYKHAEFLFCQAKFYYCHFCIFESQNIASSDKTKTNFEQRIINFNSCDVQIQYIYDIAYGVTESVYWDRL